MAANTIGLIHQGLVDNVSLEYTDTPQTTVIAEAEDSTLASFSDLFAMPATTASDSEAIFLKQLTYVLIPCTAIIFLIFAVAFLQHWRTAPPRILHHQPIRLIQDGSSQSDGENWQLLKIPEILKA